MATTKLEIIDTAIKIGLGSHLAMVGTFLVTRLNHQNELRKESRKRFYDSLEGVSSNIEEITHISLCNSY
ncbi:hypothetical protein FE810_15480 [Thalassotalea litorea]|uniref:Uncharacterized protein n=1 Tax=Thalassotalea litorea TaxID=2020715 RepID=A0A5R9IC97_9GAMM|nr:hypothetical protein [Thalassotalea litorea]TLU61221.1 hypothetical protein FE810_15480 [Thalassotalea litorea]